MQKDVMNEIKLKNYRKNEIVEAQVISVSDKEIYLDLNTFTEGIMKLDKYGTDKASFHDIVKVGDVIKAVVGSVSEEKIYLTRLPLIKEEKYALLEEKYNNKETITVQVLSKNNYGYNCTYDGFMMFLPLSQIKGEVGSEVEVRIIEMDKAKNRIVISNEVVVKEEQALQKKLEYDNLNVGDVVTCKVLKLESYGAILGLKHNYGLVRLVNISHVRIHNANEVLHVNDQIQAKIIKKENGKLEFSIKALMDTPYELYAKEHQKGDVVTGTVEQKLPFGIVLKLADHVNGFLHISEYSWNPNDNFASSLVIGTTLDLAILEIDTKKPKVSLSRKALIDNPWQNVDVEIGDVLKCKVSNIIPSKGLIVSVLGVDGFIATKDLSTEKVTRIEDLYQVGDELEASVIEFNKKQWVLNLSCKKHLLDLEQQEFNRYMESQNSDEISTSLGDLLQNLKRK